MTTSDPPDPPQDETQNTDHRLPQQQEVQQVDAVVIKFSNGTLVLELEGDDVDLGTDLKVRNEHRLIAEFRRDAVDGWWYKSSVVTELRQLEIDS